MKNKTKEFGHGTVSKFDVFDELDSRYQSKKRADKRALEGLTDEELAGLL
jgi:hypothetical protein